jgi:hypothetical protein
MAYLLSDQYANRINIKLVSKNIYQKNQFEIRDLFCVKANLFHKTLALLWDGSNTIEIRTI